MANSGDYKVTVQNEAGIEVSDTASISVVDVAPSIVRQPVDLTRKSGAVATFQAAVKSRTKVSYQWFFQSQEIPRAIVPTLTLRQLTSAQAGEYYLRASNYVGVVTTRKAVLTVTN